MYIEPCCFEKKLPELAQQPVSFFQTGGDVLASHLLSALKKVVPGGLVILTMPRVDVPLLRKLYTYLVKEWATGVVLLTQENQTEMVIAEFGKQIDKVQYAFHADVLDGQLCLTNFYDSLIVQGAMPCEIDFSLCTYSMVRTANYKLFCSALHGTLPKLRTLPSVRSTADDIIRFLPLDN